MYSCDAGMFIQKLFVLIKNKIFPTDNKLHIMKIKPTLELWNNVYYWLIGFVIGISFALFLFYQISQYIQASSNAIKNNVYKISIFGKNNNYIRVSNDYMRSNGSGEIIIKLGERDNLFSALTRNGFSRENVNEIMGSFVRDIDLRKLQSGHEFLVQYVFDVDYVAKGNSNIFPVAKKIVEKRRIKKMVFKYKKGVRYIIEDNNDAYILHIQQPKLTVKTHVISGVIKNNLFTDTIVEGVNATTLHNLLNEYAFVIDFQRDLHVGDKFIFVLETTRDNYDDLIEEKIMYSNLILRGVKYEVFNFNGKLYDRNGRTIQKNLLRTPVDGFRISSNFQSRRKHPILGYTRAHTGVDMAVPTGTPIYAAGDGQVVEIQSNHPAYGKFVKIKHNREYSTKYAHMSRIANLRVGQYVKQRQVIGYVGMTGLATGPHLHYEVIRYGKPINPRGIKAVETRKLSNEDMEDFNRVVNGIDLLVN